MAEFTKGRWKAVSLDGSYNYAIIAIKQNSQEKVVAFMLRPDADEKTMRATPNAKECTANAHLIAAAPEMYRLLEEEVSGRAWNWDIHGCAIITENYIDERRKLLDLIDGKEGEK